MRRIPWLLLVALASAPGRAWTQDVPAEGEDPAGYRGLLKSATRFKTMSAPPPAPRPIDLGGQFRTLDNDQGPVGDCHDFAAVALVEAAIYRSGGAHADLSEADLFIQGRALKPDFHAPYVNEGEDVQEGGSTYKNVQSLLSKGGVSEATLPYGEFQQAYVGEMRPELWKEMAKADVDAQRRNVRNGVDSGEKVVVGRGTKAVRNGVPVGARWVDDEATVLQAQREAATQTGGHRSRVAAFLGGRQEAMGADREENRNATRGFRAEVKRFAGEGSFDDGLAPGDECASLGSPQSDFIIDSLKAGRPVAIDFIVTGMKDWNPDKKPGGHAIVVRGIDADGGKPAFKTLNSWGVAQNFPFPLDSACRIHTATVVRIPGE